MNIRLLKKWRKEANDSLQLTWEPNFFFEEVRLEVLLKNKNYKDTKYISINKTISHLDLLIQAKETIDYLVEEYLKIMIQKYKSKYPYRGFKIKLIKIRRRK